mmetsp:Transcript_11215/g.45201  ORF Transcript_11215/g.45201 Transcript_11215/m.45201 type:complete len:523 (-) Transcript_11215:1446-3014(-)
MVVRRALVRRLLRGREGSYRARGRSRGETIRYARSGRPIADGGAPGRGRRRVAGCNLGHPLGGRRRGPRRRDRSAGEDQGRLRRRGVFRGDRERRRGRRRCDTEAEGGVDGGWTRRLYGHNRRVSPPGQRISRSFFRRRVDASACVSDEQALARFLHLRQHRSAEGVPRHARRTVPVLRREERVAGRERRFGGVGRLAALVRPLARGLSRSLASRVRRRDGAAVAPVRVDGRVPRGERRDARAHDAVHAVHDQPGHRRSTEPAESASGGFGGRAHARSARARVVTRGAQVGERLRRDRVHGVPGVSRRGVRGDAKSDRRRARRLRDAIRQRTRRRPERFTRHSWQPRRDPRRGLVRGTARGFGVRQRTSADVGTVLRERSRRTTFFPNRRRVQTRSTRRRFSPRGGRRSPRLAGEDQRPARGARRGGGGGVRLGSQAGRRVRGFDAEARRGGTAIKGDRRVVRSPALQWPTPENARKRRWAGVLQRAESRRASMARRVARSAAHGSLPVRRRVGRFADDGDR